MPPRVIRHPMPGGACAEKRIQCRRTPNANLRTNLESGLRLAQVHARGEPEGSRFQRKEEGPRTYHLRETKH
eukprot:1270063-Pyramimonas_sp.AAC.1